MAKNNRVKSTNDLELKDRLVAINRVTKVTKGGRAFSFAAIAVVGNEDGIIGWGLGKANEVQAPSPRAWRLQKRTLYVCPSTRVQSPTSRAPSSAAHASSSSPHPRVPV